MKYCGKCGKVNNDSDLYCYSCGAELGFPQQQGSGKDEKNNNLIPILVAVVLIVAIITGGAVYIFSSRSKREPEETPTVTVTEQQTVTEAAVQETTQAQIQRIYIYPGYQGGGESGYEYVSQSGFLFPSDTQLLTTSYLNTLSKDQIDLIRNELYARHGYIFKTAKYRDYFESQSWYYGYESDMEKVVKQFNTIEVENMNILVAYQGL